MALKYYSILINAAKLNLKKGYEAYIYIGNYLFNLYKGI